MAEQREPLDVDAIVKSLDTPIQKPDGCVCAYVREEPYHLVRRIINPDCEAHTPDDDGELEKERD